MKKLLFLVIVIFLGLLQATLLNNARIFLVKPDLLLLSVVMASLCFSRGWWAVGFSLFAGMLKDILSLNALGLNTVLFPLWSIIIIRLSRKISLETNFIRAIFIAIMVIVNDIVINLISPPIGNFISSGIFSKILILESLYTAAVSPLLFRLIQPLLS